MNTTVTSTGPGLAEALLKDIGNEQMQAAARLLGAHRDGYWLRRFTEEAALAMAIDRSDENPSLAWDAIGPMLLDGTLKASSSEMAVLRFAASLVRECEIQLGAVLHCVDEAEAALLVQALAAAAGLAS